MTDSSSPAGVALIPPEVRRQLSGLDYVRGIAAGIYPQSAMAHTLGYRLVEVELGRAVFVGTPEACHYNPMGTVHGGYAATLLDSCMGSAVQTTLAVGQSHTTLEFKVNFVRPMYEKTGPVRAEGRAIHVGTRTLTAEGRLTDQAGNLLAHGTTTCLILAL